MDLFGEVSEGGIIGIIAGAVGLLGGSIIVLFDRYKAAKLKWRAADVAQETAEEEARAKLEAARVKAKADLDHEEELRGDKRDQKLSANLQKIIQRLERELDVGRRETAELRDAYNRHVRESAQRERDCETRTAKLEGRVNYLTEKLADTTARLRDVEGEAAEMRRALGWASKPHTPLRPDADAGESEVGKHGPDGGAADDAAETTLTMETPAPVPLPVLPPETGPA